MSGREHVAEAERLLTALGDATVVTNVGAKGVEMLVAVAQVHATLALAAQGVTP